MTLPIVILISGAGSNMKSICHAIDEGRCAAKIAAIFSDNPNAKGIEFACERGYPTEIVKLRDYENRDQWDAALAEKIAAYHPEILVLAGFMKIVGASLLSRFPRRIINIHPALLPSFPGTDGPGLALKAGVRVTGCTVHVVDAGVDTGPIIAQAVVRIYPTDNSESLHQRIQRAEHRIFPWVIDEIAKGAIELSPELRIHTNRADDTDILFSPLFGDDRP
jgi:phosphoribosylglycinamide formyltransferase 1